MPKMIGNHYQDALMVTGTPKQMMGSGPSQTPCITWKH